TGIGTRAGGRARHWWHPGFADRSHRTWTRTPRAYGPRHAAPADTLATRLDGTIMALALHHHYRRGARRAAVDYRQRLAGAFYEPGHRHRLGHVVVGHRPYHPMGRLGRTHHHHLRAAHHAAGRASSGSTIGIVRTFDLDC